MPTEVITITVTGANPQTKTVAVNVNPTTGSGSTSVTFTGANSGQDTFNATATIASTPYTSNNAFVAWQATNGTVSLASNVTVAGYINPGENPTWHGVGSQYGILLNRNTVVVNQVYTNGTAGTGVPIVGLTTNDGNSGQYAHTPPLLDDVKSDGTALTPLGTPLTWGLTAQGDGSAVTFLQGQLIVSQSGVQTFYFLVSESWAFYVGGGASYVAGAYTTSPGGGAPAAPSTASAAVAGTSLTGVGAWPLLGTRNTPAIEVQPTDYVYINFPNAGIYPFLAWFVNNANPQTYFQMTYAAGTSAIPPASGNGESGGVIKPVALQAAPATTPSGNLQLSLAQSNVQIQGNQITINVNVNGISYPNKQYIPIFEGTPGKLFIYNNPSGGFNFQTYNGQPVDPASAATNAFTLSGNTQSLLSVAYNNSGDGQFSLVYSGTPFPIGIAASTQLTVTAEDIAWFNSVNKTYDTFSPASVGGPGGISFSIEVDYMTNPGAVSVSPSSVPADGTVHVLTVTLSEPMSPQQTGSGNLTSNTVTPSFSSDSGTSVQSGVTAQYNTSGFLTGYTVPVQVPFSTSNGSFNLFTSLTGSLSYLSGTSFVNNGPVTYMSNVGSAVGLSGSGFQPPVAYAFSISPNSTNLDGGSYLLSGTAYTLDNNPMTMAFYYNNAVTGVNFIGNGVLQSSSPGTINGQTVYFQTFIFTFNPPTQSVSYNSNNLLGFVATDTASGLQATYYSSTAYTFPVTITYGVTLVQTAVAQFFSGGGGNPATAAFASPVTQGNVVVVSYNEFDNSSYIPTITDLYGNVGGFFQASPFSYNSKEQATAIYVGIVYNTGNCQLQFNNLGGHISSNDNNAMASICAEFNGINNPVQIDGSNAFNQSTSGTSFSYSTGAFSTTNPNDVIFSASNVNSGQPIGWSFVTGGNGFPSSWTAGLAWTVVTAAGSYNPTWVSHLSSGTSCAMQLTAQGALKIARN